MSGNKRAAIALIGIALGFNVVAVWIDKAALALAATSLFGALAVFFLWPADDGAGD